MSAVELDRRPAGRLPALTLGVSLLVTFAALAGWFAAHQTLWVDETTQLSGLTLSPRGVVEWLAGDRPNRFGVPGDRQPPLSYWLGMGWAQLFGGSENSLRSMGVVLTTAGLAAGLAAIRRVGGDTGLFVGGSLLALSPNLQGLASAIRPYPLYFFAASGSVLLLLESAAAPTERSRNLSWGGAVAFCVLAAWTHFFGVVLGGAVSVASLIHAIWRRTSLVPWAIGTGVMVLSWLLLWPFVRASIDLTGSSHDTPELSLGVWLLDVVRMLYRLLAHPSTMVSRVVLVSLVVGLMVLLALALVRVVRALRGPGREAPVVILFALMISGLAAPLVTSLSIRSFDALAPHYNLWAIVPMAALASTGMTVSLPRAGRLPASLGATLALIGVAGSSFVLARHPSVFSNGPSEALWEVFREREPEIILHASNGPWGFTYFPLRYHLGPEVRQGKWDPVSGRIEWLTVEPEVSTELEALPEEAPIMLVWSTMLGAADLRRHLLGTADVGPQTTAVTALDGRPILESTEFIAFTAATAVVLGPEVSAHPSPAPADRTVVP